MRARPLYIYFFEVVIIFGTLQLFFRGRNNFGRDCGERARPLYMYFYEVIIILGETEVRGPDQSTHSTFIFSRS